MKKIFLAMILFITANAQASFSDKDIDVMAYGIVGVSGGGTRLTVPRFTLTNELECAVANTDQTMGAYCARMNPATKPVTYKLGGAGHCLMLKNTDGKFELIMHDEPAYKKYQAVTELVCGS